MALNENFWKDIDDLDEEENDEIDEEDDQEEANEHQEKNNLSEEIQKNQQQQSKKTLTKQQQIEELKQEFQKKHQEYSLLKDENFTHLIERVNYFLAQDLKNYSHAINTKDEEYQLIVKCNEFLNNVDREIMLIHKTCRDIYFERYPELEQIVLSPIDYCKTVQKIQNESDLNKVDLSNILNSHQIVTVKVTGSSTSGKPLNAAKLSEVLLYCDQVLQLDSYKKKLLNYVQSRMEYIAPNLSNLVGSNISSKLMAAAGGLEQLANIPSCNIQVLGSQKRNLLGFSKQGQKLHMGFFGELEMVKHAPEKFQIKLVRRLSNNCAKAARVDLNRTQPDGSLGAHFKEEMMQKFMKIQEPPPPKKIKPLIIDDKPKKKRGGKKIRQMKERMGLTDTRKLAQRMNFGPEEEQQFRSSGKGFGMLGMGGRGQGKVKLNQGNNKVKLSKKQQQLAKKVQLKGSSGATGGISSSIAFTPIQAMELVNPEIMKAPMKKTPDQYFNKETGFKTVVENKKKEKTEFDNILGKI